MRLSRWRALEQTNGAAHCTNTSRRPRRRNSFLTEEQGAALTQRLKSADPYVALGAEWELLVLTAFDNEGTLTHEPNLGGAARLDFHVTDSELDTILIGDITTITDDTVKRYGTSVLTQMLVERFYQREHLEGALTVRVERETTSTGERPRLPLMHEFRQYVFGTEGHEFVNRIRTTPRQLHQVRSANERAGLVLDYAPGRSLHRLRGLSEAARSRKGRNLDGIGTQARAAQSVGSSPRWWGALCGWCATVPVPRYASVHRGMLIHLDCETDKLCHRRSLSGQAPAR